MESLASHTHSSAVVVVVGGGGGVVAWVVLGV